MSSPSSSSSGTAGRSHSRRPRPSSRVTAWSAAAFTAAALYALPSLVLAALAAQAPLTLAGLVVDLGVLLVVAVCRWSPLVVLGAATASIVGGLFFLAGTALGETCGTSNVAQAIELAGGLVLAIPLGAWGVRRGVHALWAIPVGWLTAGAWLVAWAHVIPHGSGGCFE